MARLPEVGKDSGNWGQILNEFLTQSLNADGTVKNDIVGAPQLRASSVTTSAISNGTITNAKIANGTLSEDKFDTATLAKLNTAGSGSIADGTITNAKISTNAAIDQSKVAGLTAALSVKADDSAVMHKAGNETITGVKNFTGTLQSNGAALVVSTDSRLTDQRTPADNSVTTAKLADESVTNAKIASDAAIDQSKISGLSLAFGAKADISHTHTPSQVGLGNVDNTSDANKPISTAQAVAINAKLDTSAAPELIRDTIGTALVAGANITITPNDNADTITIAATTGSGSGTGYAADVPSGSTTPTITHSLGTRDVQVTVYDKSADPWIKVNVDVSIPVGGNTVTLGFLNAPTVGQYRVVVVRA